MTAYDVLLAFGEAILAVAVILCLAVGWVVATSALNEMAKAVIAAVAILLVAVALAMAPRAHAEGEPPACMSAALSVAWSQGPGVEVRRITSAGVNPAAVVEAWLANAGAPDLNAEDFILAADGEKVVITPVRAGLVCRNFQRVAVPLARGGQALLKAVELAESGRGRA